MPTPHLLRIINILTLHLGKVVRTSFLAKTNCQLEDLLQARRKVKYEAPNSGASGESLGVIEVPYALLYRIFNENDALMYIYSQVLIDIHQDQVLPAYMSLITYVNYRLQNQSPLRNVGSLTESIDMSEESLKELLLDPLCCPTYVIESFYKLEDKDTNVLPNEYDSSCSTPHLFFRDSLIENEELFYSLSEEFYTKFTEDYTCVWDLVATELKLPPLIVSKDLSVQLEGASTPLQNDIFDLKARPLLQLELESKKYTKAQLQYILDKVKTLATVRFKTRLQNEYLSSSSKWEDIIYQSKLSVCESPQVQILAYGKLGKSKKYLLVFNTGF